MIVYDSQTNTFTEYREMAYVVINRKTGAQSTFAAPRPRLFSAPLERKGNEIYALEAGTDNVYRVCENGLSAVEGTGVERTRQLTLFDFASGAE